MKIQQNKKSARKLSKKAVRQIRKNKPKMSNFSQKHAQYAFSSKLKLQKCHKVWNKSNPQNTNLQKTSPKDKQISIKQAQKQATRKTSKKPATPQKNKPKFVGKPKGWQHCNTLFKSGPFRGPQSHECQLLGHGFHSFALHDWTIFVWLRYISIYTE